MKYAVITVLLLVAIAGNGQKKVANALLYYNNIPKGDTFPKQVRPYTLDQYHGPKRIDTVRRLQHQVSTLERRINLLDDRMNNAWKMFPLIIKWHLEDANEIDSVSRLAPFRNLHYEPFHWYQDDAIDTFYTAGRNKGGYLVTIGGDWEISPTYDTVEVARLISNTLKSTFWRPVDHFPIARTLYQIKNQKGETIGYLNRKKQPLPAYWKIWEN